MTEILAREGDIIIVRKPCGVSSQGGEKAGRDLLTILEAELGARPLPLHRLDRDTEGALALALTREAASAWAPLIEGGGARKRYLAVVSGSMEGTEGTIEGDIVQRGRKLKALTKWRLLEAFDLSAGSFSLLEIELGTGRMHQIRIHLSSVGHPLLGDDKHGDFSLNRALRKSLGLRKLMLLARELRLEAPDGRCLSALCPLPPHFLSFLEQAGAGAVETLEGRLG